MEGSELALGEGAALMSTWTFAPCLKDTQGVRSGSLVRDPDVVLMCRRRRLLIMILGAAGA